MSSYHRNQYIEIGDVLRITGASEETIESFCNLFEDDNHRFNKEKFLIYVATDDEGY
jgi:hypothetical protein